MPSIYIDESGQMSRNSLSERFFCVASIEMTRPELIKNQFMTWKSVHFFHSAFRKCEIKFSLGAISPSLRLRTLKFISSLDIRINVTYFENTHIPPSYIKHSASFMPPGSIVGSQMVDSTSTVNIQIADWVVGAFAAHVNEKPNGHEYWNALIGKALVQRYPFPSGLDNLGITVERERDG